ncbi:hypothetical protein LTR10_007286 [Elasticomyces elasticus]|nr:hypothetical protein LTR10_007286 [Elasticomyces elasticus]KAK4979099.1 hypothetical protein LTR42_001601 [Elasticomyces elasticus]
MPPRKKKAAVDAPPKASKSGRRNLYNEGDLTPLGELDADFPIYQPGPQSHHFMKTPMKCGNKLTSFTMMLALDANDAMVYILKEKIVVPGFMQGIYLVSRRGAHTTDFTAETEADAGAHIFFAPFHWGPLDIELWERSPVREKIRLSSTFFKHPHLCAISPVMPIWGPGSHKAEPTWDTDSLPGSRRMPWSTEHEDVDGVWCDILEGILLFMPAVEMLDHARWKYLGCWQLVLDKKQQGRQMPTVVKNRNWLLERLNDCDGLADPILAFLGYVGDFCRAHPDHMMPYQDARSWSNRAELTDYSNLKWTEERKAARSKEFADKAKAKKANATRGEEELDMRYSVEGIGEEEARPVGGQGRQRGRRSRVAVTYAEAGSENDEDAEYDGLEDLFDGE